MGFGKGRKTASLVMLTALLAVLVKSLFPAGFMPAYNDAGFTELVICSGMGEKTIRIPAFGDSGEPGTATDPSDHGGDKTADGHPPCPFSLVASAKLLLPAVPAIVALPAFLRVPTDVFPIIRPKTSPLLAFTARGPPVRF